MPEQSILPDAKQGVVGVISVHKGGEEKLQGRNEKKREEDYY